MVDRDDPPAVMIGVQQKEFRKWRFRALLDVRVAEHEGPHAPRRGQGAQFVGVPSPAPDHSPGTARAQGVVGILQWSVEDAEVEAVQQVWCRQRMGKEQPVGRAHRQGHRTHESAHRLLHEARIVAEGPIEPGIELLEVVAGALGDRMTERLGQLVVREHDVHLPGMPHGQQRRTR